MQGESHGIVEPWLQGIEEETLFMRRMTSDDFVGGGADLQTLLEMGVDGEAELAQRVRPTACHVSRGLMTDSFLGITSKGQL